MNRENSSIFKTSPRRSRLERIVAILRALQRTSKPTQVMALANTNYRELQKYIQEMQTLNLIQILEEKHRVRTVKRYLISAEGLNLLNNFHIVEDRLGIKATG